MGVCETFAAFRIVISRKLFSLEDWVLLLSLGVGRGGFGFGGVHGVFVDLWKGFSYGMGDDFFFFWGCQIFMLLFHVSLLVYLFCCYFFGGVSGIFVDLWKGISCVICYYWSFWEDL